MGRVLLAAMFVASLMAAEAVVAPAQSQTASPSEFSGQYRPRTRLRITPLPGPWHRECVFRLVPEWRPSGTVIVPRQKCWWVRG